MTTRMPRDAAKKKPKTGKYSISVDAPLPDSVARAMSELNPDWDWWSSEGWVVLRMFDEGREFQRVAAVIKKQVIR